MRKFSLFLTIFEGNALILTMKNTTHQQFPHAFSFLWIDKLSLFFAVALFILATLSIGLNHYYWQYSTVNYLADGMGDIFLFLSFCTLGVYYSIGRESTITQCLLYMLIYHTMTSLVMYSTNGVQLTPFAPIDPSLLQMDRFFHYDTCAILDFITQHAWLKKTLAKAYTFIDVELFFLPLYLLCMRQFYTMKQFFYLLLSTALIGYLVYYFFPTTAPASVLKGAYFLREEYNTGLKFYMIHHHMLPSSIAGGLISMPSFHIIWAIICQYATRPLRWLWYTLLPLNTMVILSALFLGWHYLVDFFGSVCVIALSVGIAWCYRECFSKKVVGFQK